MYNCNNVIRLEHGAGSVHAKVSGYYSSKPQFTGGQTVRQWLSGKSFQEQYDFGIKALKQLAGNLNNKIMINIKNNEVALEIFEKASIKQAEATEQGNYKLGNKCYEEINKAVDFLRKNNAIDVLDIYLNSHFVGVRLWAAYFLLPIRETESIQVLEEIAKSSGIHSLTAETTLDEWNKGALKF